MDFVGHALAEGEALGAKAQSVVAERRQSVI